MFMLFLAAEAYYTSAPVCFALIAAGFYFRQEAVSGKILQETV
jgi:hypothetical protein